MVWIIVFATVESTLLMLILATVIACFFKAAKFQRNRRYSPDGYWGNWLFAFHISGTLRWSLVMLLFGVLAVTVMLWGGHSRAALR